MSLSECGICGQGIGPASASRCEHQALVASPIPDMPADDADWLKKLVAEWPVEADEIEEVDLATFDSVITGSVGGTLLTLPDTQPDSRST